MAIAFARVSIHTRSKGHSAVAASSYRSGTKLLDVRTGITHDYSNRCDVVYTEIILPKDCDKSFSKREFLWNQAELVEKRRDAQVCKDIVLALPKELNLEQQIELTKLFVDTHFTSNGLPADIAIHNHSEGNPHVHILVPTRRLEKDGFSKYKARDLNPVFAKGHIVEKDYWGRLWQDSQNEFFLEKGFDITVDVNHIIPERHLGKNHAKSSYLLEENTIIQQSRKDLAYNNVENIISHISSELSVFTRRDVEKLLFKTLKNNQESQDYLILVEQVLASKNVIHLGVNDNGKDCFTTPSQYIEEAKLRSNIEKMLQRYNHVFIKEGFNLDDFTKFYNLSEEQASAFDYIINEIIKKTGNKITKNINMNIFSIIVRKNK